jgi:hypothetical protein
VGKADHGNRAVTFGPFRAIRQATVTDLWRPRFSRPHYDPEWPVTGDYAIRQRGQNSKGFRGDFAI